MATNSALKNDYGYGGNRWLIDTQKDMNILPVRRGCYNVGVRLLAVRILQPKRKQIEVDTSDGVSNVPESVLGSSEPRSPKAVEDPKKPYKKVSAKPNVKQVINKTNIGQIYHVCLETQTFHSMTFLSKSQSVQALCSYVIGRDDRVTAVREFSQPLEYFKINFQQTDVVELSLRDYRGERVPCEIQMLVDLNDV